MQNDFSSLEDKYNKAKQLIRGMQDRERQVIMKVRYRSMCLPQFTWFWSISVALDDFEIS